MSQCPNCGTAFEPGDRFCAVCGGSLAGAPPAAEPVAAPPAVEPVAAPPWYRTGTGILGIGMTLAAVAAVVVVLMVSGDDEGVTATPPGPTVTSPSTPGIEAVTLPTDPSSTTTTTTSSEPTTTTSSTSSTAATTTTALAAGFSEEFKDVFMDGCLAGGNRSFCRCVLDGFEDLYAEDQLLDILEGRVEPPDGFSEPSIGCYIELPESAPLAAFALPNTCTVDTWGMVVHYPAGWAVEDEVRACFAYRPDDAPPGSMAIIVGFYNDTTMDEYLASAPPSDYVVEHLDRDVHIWVTPVGESVGVEFVFRLWKEIPDSPLVVVMADTSVTLDAWTVADMMIRALEIEPYSP